MNENLILFLMELKKKLQLNLKIMKIMLGDHLCYRRRRYVWPDHVSAKTRAYHKTCYVVNAKEKMGRL